MGQKINPHSIRLGVINLWDSKWFDKKNYVKLVASDFEIRRFLNKKLSHVGLSKIVIERLANKVSITLHAARPGIIIGKNGADIEILKKDLKSIVSEEVTINIVEVRKPELDAKLAAESIAKQLEKRADYRKAMRRVIQSARRMGALGIRVNCSGRLGGAEIARMEWQREGRVPLHTLRADIDYGQATAQTTYGSCGIKVWIFKGEILDKHPLSVERREGGSVKPTSSSKQAHN